MSVTLELIRCADSFSPPGWVYRPQARGSLRRALGLGVARDEWIPMPVGAFLVRHPEHGPILIDTGLSALAAENIRADFGRLNARFFSALQSQPEQTIARQLRARGVDARGRLSPARFVDRL